MKKTPRISVMMPAYNSEKYIGEAIESILNQTFADFELIVLNDSPDNAELDKIIKEYAKKDKRVKYVKNPKNLGIPRSRNKLLQCATGEYLACMDSDDVAMPTRFEKQIRYMEEHPECGVLGTWFKCFGKSDNVVRHPERIKILNLLANQHVGNPTVLIRKSVIDKYDFTYNETYDCAQDFELWTRMIFVTEIHNLPEILLKYRWHGNNVSIEKAKRQLYLANQAKQNILNRLTLDETKQKYILDCARQEIKCGILLPKWLGRICCLFIPKREIRHRFRDKYVKEK